MAKILPIGQRFNRKSKKYEDISVIAPKFEFVFPEGFCIIRDTREQVGTGLFVKPPKGLLIVRDTLKYGDYSIKNFENSIVVERKGIDDLWTSVTVDADAFKKKMMVIAQYERKWLLIDGLESEFLGYREGRKIHPNQIRQALAKIEGYLGIPIHQSESMEASERWMIDTFIRFFQFKRGL
ncbi:MAG: ERCC4 domain-containing protein [Thermoplasmata archaeon]|nr:ERCC4 domain-containing protein [Thermoplasmata archaeon]